MKLTRILLAASLGLVLLTGTGCFRVSSETRVLRDAALENGVDGAEETIEFGVGFFTVGLVKLGARFVELPPEAKMAIGSVDGAEVSIYELHGKKGDPAVVLKAADKGMSKRGWERVVKEYPAAVVFEDGTRASLNLVP